MRVVPSVEKCPGLNPESVQLFGNKLSLCGVERKFKWQFGEDQWFLRTEKVQTSVYTAGLRKTKKFSACLGDCMHPLP